MIIKRKKIIFLHIPKCAGKSVERFFLGKTIPNPHATDWKIRKEIINGKYDDYYKFVVIRDPIERLVSVYNYYKNGGTKSRGDMGIKRKLDDVDINSFVLNIDKYKGKIISHYMLGPQRRWCYNGKIKIVDDILLFDDLPDNILEIGKRYNINKKFPHANKSKKISDSKDLSEESVYMINNYYKKDFDLIESIKRGK